jgi:hypothetical protein
LSRIARNLISAVEHPDVIVLLDGETGDVGLIRRPHRIATPTGPPCQAYLPSMVTSGRRRGGAEQQVTAPGYFRRYFQYAVPARDT